MNIPLSPHHKRKVSSFIAQELLYDHITGNLDEERRRAVEAELEADPKNQQTVDEMKKALDYIEKINRIEVDRDMLAGMNESASYLAVVLKKTRFDKWPTSVKWSIEALIVVFGVVLFLVVVPWDQALKMSLFPKDKEIILAEVPKDPAAGSTENLIEMEKKEAPQFPDEEKKEDHKMASDASGNKVVAQSPALHLSGNPQKQVEEINPVSEDSVPEETEKVSAETASASPTPSTAEDPEKKAQTGSGFLYRGHLEVTNVEMNSPKITEKIMELGGRKAGEVDIGWKKNDSTYYYHFTLPEAKYDELITFLSGYSKAELKKEKHPRVMPDGIIRLIITVDETKK